MDIAIEDERTVGYDGVYDPAGIFHAQRIIGCNDRSARLQDRLDAVDVFGKSLNRLNVCGDRKIAARSLRLIF